MRAGDRLRDLGERGIGFPGIFETLLRHDDSVRPTAPFPHEPRPRPDAWIGIGNDAPVRFQLLDQRHELPLSRFAEAAIGKLLHAIGDCSDQQVAAQSRRRTPVQSPPFCAELLDGKIRQRCEFL